MFVNTEIWNIDKEEIIKDNNGNTPIIKPIMKICPHQSRKYVSSCKTEKCSKDEDCFSGMCSSKVCVMNEQVNHIIYRCTGNSKNIKCNKQLGMSCGSDEDCYSGSCLNYYCSNEKRLPDEKVSIPYGLIIVFASPIIITCLVFLILHIPCLNKNNSEVDNKYYNNNKLFEENKFNILLN